MVARSFILRGVVFSGLGKGSFFISLDDYKRFFRELLGEDPYPGTLNIKLKNRSWKDINWWGKFQPKNGWGAIYYSVGVLGDSIVIIIRPILSRHESNVVEIVSAENLRKKLNLKDGDEVSVILKLRYRS